MSKYYWRGSVSTAWNTAGNWIDETGAIPSTYPGATAGTYDDVYLDADPASNGIAGFSTPLTEKLASLRIGNQYAKALGSSGSPITIAVDNLIISASAMAAASIQAYIKTTYAAKVLINGGLINLEGNVTVISCLTGTAVLDIAIDSGGKLYLASTPTASAPIVTLQDCGYIIDAVVSGGTLTTESEMSLIQYGGTVNLKNGAESVVLGAGILNWQGGDIDLLETLAGSVSTSLILDASVETLRVFNGATVNFDNGLSSASYSDLDYYGGSFQPGKGL